mmetsp:Transcript_13809/g.27488  ORF Transcript_13809/g.27488 Transcript_13809/m.27488 type:complete len:114 (+) Transcript_13809:1014-1355(+)
MMNMCCVDHLCFQACIHPFILVLSARVCTIVGLKVSFLFYNAHEAVYQNVGLTCVSCSEKGSRKEDSSNKHANRGIMLIPLSLFLSSSPIPSLLADASGPREREGEGLGDVYD